MDLETLLADRLAPAFAAVAGEPADPAVRRSPHADFQSGAALALARRLGRPPRDIAADVVRAADLDDLCASVEVSGPGFVNLIVADGALGPLLDAMAADERLGVPPPARVGDGGRRLLRAERGQGDARRAPALDRHRRRGSRGCWSGSATTSCAANHLGDWGTPFGMLIEHLLDLGETEARTSCRSATWTAFYQATRGRSSTPTTAFRHRSRRRVVALQSGDADDAAGCGGCWSTSPSGTSWPSTTGSASP